MLIKSCSHYIKDEFFVGCADLPATVFWSVIAGATFICRHQFPDTEQ